MTIFRNRKNGRLYTIQHKIVSFNSDNTPYVARAYLSSPATFRSDDTITADTLDDFEAVAVR